MQLEFDESRVPELTRFRKACLADRFAEMDEIASRGHPWYENENPDSLPMEKLAKVFQAQFFAEENDQDQLEGLLTEHPWVVNFGWTAQRWLPLTQACSHGDQEMLRLLLDRGADPTLSVGDPNDRATVPQMARYAGNDDTAQWLEQVIRERAGV